MTGQQTLIARVALGAVAGVVGVVLALLPRLRAVSGRQFDRALFAAFSISRLGIFALVFLVFRIAPRGDVLGYYLTQAEQVLRHRLPYRDFVSSYAPLHPYLDAGLISLWHTPLSIMFFSLFAELLLLPLWMRAGREFLPESELRAAALLYLASPISLQFVALDGQDNVVIAVLIALAMLLILRSRIFAAGIALGASVAAIKFLPLLYAPTFFVAVPRRWRLVAGALVVSGVVYGGFALLHAPVLEPLSAEADLRSSGDLPYVLEAILGVVLPPRLSDGCLLLVLAAILIAVARAAYGASLSLRLRALTFGMAAATLALLLLSKKSWPPYAMLALFPVCLLVRRVSAAGFSNAWRGVAFAIFSLAAVSEHSYWASMFAQFSSAEFHAALRTGRTDVQVLLGVEVVLIAGYLWLLCEAFGRLMLRADRLPDLARQSR